jgi:hypothetical protein
VRLRAHGGQVVAAATIQKRQGTIVDTPSEHATGRVHANPQEAPAAQDAQFRVTAVSVGGAHNELEHVLAQGVFTHRRGRGQIALRPVNNKIDRQS